MKNASLWLLLALVILTLIPFHAVRDFDFVAYDDHEYVYENPRVLEGLSPAGIHWAFTTLANANWHPLTWLSHQLDVTLFGTNPGGHHLSSLMLHLFAVLLLFGLARAWTGRSDIAFLIAAFWAIHPQRAESVVWISERKDVLSLLLGLAAMHAYTRWMAFAPQPTEPGAPPNPPLINRWYAATLALFALGLMAKPMLVTLPVLLGVLDWGLWRRFGWPGQSPRAWLRPVLEKIPLLALTIASSIVTYIAQNQGAVVAWHLLPWSTRLLNAALAYLAYVAKTVWPLHLSVYYPYTADQAQPWLAGGAAAAALALTTFLLFRRRHRFPLLLTGWLWFLGTLVPVIGLVQVGGQAMADRYSYLPSIGLWLMAWSYLPPPTRTGWRRWLFPVAVVLLIPLLALARRQVATWQSTTTLFEQALRIDPRNDLAHYSLGMQKERQGLTNEAAAHFVTTLNINSNYYEAHLALGNIAGAAGDFETAARHFAAVLRLAPRNLDAWLNLGMAAREAGDLDLTEHAYDQALRIAPDNPDVHYFSGILRIRRGQLDLARAAFEQAVALHPAFADGWNSLGKVAYLEGRFSDALTLHQKAIVLDPRVPEFHLNRGLAHERLGEDGPALQAFARAANLNPQYGDAFACLGNLMMKYGKRADAIRLYERAIEIDPQHPGYRRNLARARGY